MAGSGPAASDAWHQCACRIAARLTSCPAHQHVVPHLESNTIQTSNGCWPVPKMGDGRRFRGCKVLLMAASDAWHQCAGDFPPKWCQVFHWRRWADLENTPVSASRLRRVAANWRHSVRSRLPNRQYSQGGNRHDDNRNRPVGRGMAVVGLLTGDQNIQPADLPGRIMCPNLHPTSCPLPTSFGRQGHH